MITEVSKISGGNRVVIPVSIRKSLGLEVGDNVMLVLQDNGEVRLLAQRDAVRQAQTLVRRYFCEERSLVDELLAERKAESGKE